MTASNESEIIVESLMFEYLKNKAVKRISIEETPHGTYIVSVRLPWKVEEMRVVTARKKIKEWASMDSLIRRLKKN